MTLLKVFLLIKIVSDFAGFFKSPGINLDCFNSTLVSHKEMPTSNPQANPQAKLLTVPLETFHLMILIYLFLSNIKMKQAKLSKLHRNHHKEFFPFLFKMVHKKLSLKSTFHKTAQVLIQKC